MSVRSQIGLIVPGLVTHLVSVSEIDVASVATVLLTEHLTRLVCGQKP